VIGAPTWPVKGRPQSHRVNASLEAFISSIAAIRPRVCAIRSNLLDTDRAITADVRESDLDHWVNHSRLNFISPMSRKRFRRLYIVFIVVCFMVLVYIVICMLMGWWRSLFATPGA
jgi:hypothetical protein